MPYALGVACNANNITGPGLTVSLLPVDHTLLGATLFRGFRVARRFHLGLQVPHQHRQRGRDLHAPSSNPSICVHAGRHDQHVATAAAWSTLPPAPSAVGRAHSRDECLPLPARPLLVWNLDGAARADRAVALGASAAASMRSWQLPSIPARDSGSTASVRRRADGRAVPHVGCARHRDPPRRAERNRLRREARDRSASRSRRRSGSRTTMIEPRLPYDRRGISLPLVILMMALLALALTAGFSRVSEERRIVGDQQAQVEALAVAESGLERFVALLDTMPGGFDSVAIPIGPRDTAFVAILGIRKPAASSGPVRAFARAASVTAHLASAPTPRRHSARSRSMPPGMASPWSVLSAWTSHCRALRSSGRHRPAQRHRCLWLRIPTRRRRLPCRSPFHSMALTAIATPRRTRPAAPPIVNIGADPTRRQPRAVLIDWNSHRQRHGPRARLRPDEHGWLAGSLMLAEVVASSGSMATSRSQAANPARVIVVIPATSRSHPDFTWNGVVLVRSPARR